MRRVGACLIIYLLGILEKMGIKALATPVVRTSSFRVNGYNYN